MEISQTSMKGNPFNMTREAYLAQTRDGHMFILEGRLKSYQMRASAACLPARGDN